MHTLDFHVLAVVHEAVMNTSLCVLWGYLVVELLVTVESGALLSTHSTLLIVLEFHVCLSEEYCQAVFGINSTSPR